MDTIGINTSLRKVFLDTWRPFAWIAVVIFILYARTAAFEFTNLDDKDLITDNYSFISDPSNIPQAFMSRVFPKLLAPYYRPLLTVSFMADAALGGTQPFVYHCTNILIHTAVCWLIFSIFLKLGFKRPSALLFTVFFAIHPALVQAVAWVPGRNDSLLTLFSLVSFLSFIRYLEFPRAGLYLLHLIFLALALFTKETAIVTIAMCGLYSALLCHAKPISRQKRLLVIGWASVVAVWFFARQAALKGSFDSEPGGLISALFVSIPAVIQYIGKVLFPFNLSVFPTIQDTTFAYGIIAIMLIVFLLYRSKERRVRYIIFGILWFLLYLAPSLLRPSATFVHDFQEHRMYLPMVGALILFNEIDFLKNITKRVAILCAVLLCIFTVINLRHTENFRNKVTYWSNAVETAPGSVVTHMRAGYVYFEEGDYVRAEKEYKAALKIDRVLAGAYAGLGHIYLKRDRPKDAELEFRRAIACYDGNYPSYVTLGTIYYRQGRLKEASDMWVGALKLDPENIGALKNMAIFCTDQKDYAAAQFYVKKLRLLGVEPPREFLRSIGEK